MMEYLYKKGQVNSLAPAVIALVFAGILLVFGLVVLQETRDTNVVRQANYNTVLNESVSTVLQSGVSVAGIAAQCANSFSAIAVINDTGEWLAGNFTMSSAGVISFTSTSTADAARFNNSNWNVSYNYYSGDEACEAGNATVAGLGTFSSFWEIIVLTIVMSVVIGLLLSAFASKRNR